MNNHTLFQVEIITKWSENKIPKFKKKFLLKNLPNLAQSNLRYRGLKFVPRDFDALFYGEVITK